MKIVANILLGALSLTFSSISIAEETAKSKYVLSINLVKHCATEYGFRKLGSGWIDTKTEYKTFNYIKEENELNYSQKDVSLVQDCVQEQLPIIIYGYGWTKLSKAELNIKKNEMDELYNSFEYSQNTIIDKSKKFKFEFTNVVPPKRADICADKKGKFDYGFDEYAFCMGTKVHQSSTCQNQYGDPCGTKYDKGRAGYTIREN